MFDGDIICKSEAGEGTRFVLVLALGGNEISNQSVKSKNSRMKNPVLKVYDKMELNYTNYASNRAYGTNKSANKANKKSFD